MWVAFAHLPWAAMLFASAANTIVFTLEIRKFTANPAAIATLLTFTGFLTMFTGPLTNWVSDRIWTRFGRRKVFYVPAVFAQGILILFVPFAPSLGWLAFVYFLQFLALSCKSPNEILNQEIIPNHQRGRAAVFNKIYVQFGLMAYNLALIGRFDDVYPNAPISRFLTNITGEKLIFVVFSLALLSVVFLVALGIKELKPARLRSMKADLGGKVTLWRIIKQLFIDTFSAEWWPLYLLAISQAMYGVKLGGMVALMYTDQWEYSAQVLGTTQGIAQLVSILVVIFIFPLADKFDKLKFYLVTICLGFVGKVLWYSYVMLLVPDNRPSIMEIILIGEGMNILGQLAGIISYPLVYEYIPLNKLGTATAGLGLFRGFLGMVLGPMMGIWLLFYSNIFMPGAGSNVVILFNEPMTQAQLAPLEKQWEAETGQRIWSRILKPYNTQLDASRQWEIRVRDEGAEVLDNQIKLIEARIIDAQRAVDDFGLRGLKPTTEALELKVSLNGELKALRAKQADLAIGFREYLRGKLAGQLASAERGVASIQVEGRTLSFEGETAYAVGTEQAAKFADELALKLGLPAGAVQITTSGNDQRLLRVTATFPEGHTVKIAGKSALYDRVNALLADGRFDDAQAESARDLVAASAEVIEGKRNALLIPFPDANYKPQKVDYFSSYLFMAITDVFAILIAIYLIRAEKAGKIQRRGKLEDEASSGAHGKAAPAVAQHVATPVAAEHLVAPLSPDPQVVTHPDGTQTFTPGMKMAKLAVCGLGLALTLFGVWWQTENIRLFLLGDTTTATVVSVSELKTGQATVVLDTRKAVGDAVDPTRNTLYHYNIQFKDTTGREHTTILNYGQLLRPLLSIGDKVTIAYDTEKPSVVIDKYDIRTWAFGGFFFGIGLLMLIPQWFLWRTADKPIVLDQIVDYEAIKEQQARLARNSGPEPHAKKPQA